MLLTNKLFCRNIEVQNGNGAETPLLPRERALPGWVGSFFLPALQIAVNPGSYQRTDNTNYDTSVSNSK